MAIPVAEIPNAPQIGPDPAMMSVPNARTDLSGVARNLMAAPIRQGAYDGAAQGMQAIGEAGQKVAGVLSHLSGVMAEAQNTASLAKAETLLSEAYAQHEIESATKDPNEWVPSWQAKQSKLMSQVEKLPLTPGGKRQMELYTAQFMGNSSISLAKNANKRIIEDARLGGETMFKTRIAAGDYEGAAIVKSELVSKGILSKNEGDAWMVEAEKRQKDDFIASEMMADPDGLIQEVESGNIAMPDEEKQQVIARAKQVKRQQVAEADDELDQLVLTGEVKTEQEIREWGEARGIPERQILSHLKSLSVVNESTEAGQAAIQSARGDIQAAISAYNPETDANDKDYFAIKDQIRASLPEGLRQEFLSDLSSMRKEGRKTPEKEIKASIFSQINELKTADFFGKGDKPKDKLLAAQKANSLMDQFREYQKQMGAKLTQADADAWLAAQVNGDVKKAVRQKVLSPAVPAQPVNLGFGGSIVPRPQPKTAKQLADEIDKELLSSMPTE